MENKKPFSIDQAAIRLVREPPLYSDFPLDSPQAVVKLLADLLKDYDREVFVIVNLRPDLKPINLNIVSIGALDQGMAHPREILKTAILSNAAAIMMAHNHTSGHVSPSKEDVRVTDRMSKICELIGIKLTDHIIVGPGDNYYSFYEKQQMPLSGLKLASGLEEIKLEGMKVAETATIEQKKQTVVSFTVAECSEFHNIGELHENIPTMKEAIELFQQIQPDRIHGIPAIGVRVTDANHPELFTEIDIVTGKVIDLEVLGYVPEIANNKAAQYAIAELLHKFSNVEIRGEVPEEIQKKVQVLESREKQETQLKEITDKLEQGVQDVFSSDDYKRFLTVMAKMPSYSVNNLILIAMQTEGKASMCQSFTGWKQMDRYVKQGERGIKILAPVPYTIQKENDKLDLLGKPLLDADGKPVKEKKDITINSFKVVSTFDISQTDGKEMPSLGVNELVGNIEGYSSLMMALKEASPVPISFENIEGDAKGYYHKTEKRIAIQEGMSEVQTVKTAIHEMAHQKLHTDISSDVMNQQSRNSKEVEAEGVAYVICQRYGINTSDYSFGYVAGWSEGREVTELKASLNTIRQAASEMITVIDEKLTVILQEQAKDIIHAEDVTNICGMNYDYSPVTRTAEYTFSCEVKGKSQILSYEVSEHDDGKGFTLHTDKNDIWGNMSETELRKLEITISREAEIYKWECRIDRAVTLEDVEDVRIGIMETDNLGLPNEHIQRLFVSADKKEQSIGQVISAMEANGYSFDAMESGIGNLRFFGEGGQMVTFESWKQTSEWLDGVVFDDPKTILDVEKTMHPERFDNSEKDPEKKSKAKVKSEKKTSVKKKIQEGKDTVVNTSRKKTTKHDMVACV